MTDRPDLRHITSDIRAALADADRDTLVDVLTYVFEEYVIESPPPMRVPPPAGLDDLAELDFPALVERLQTHLDHPELDRFRVQGEQVFVRVGGALTPLDAPAPEPEAAPPAPEPAEPARPAEPRVEAPTEPPADAESGRPSGSGATSAPASGAGAGAESSSGQGRNAGPARDRPADDPEPGGGDDDASIRFSLLELD